MKEKKINEAIKKYASEIKKLEEGITCVYHAGTGNAEEGFVDFNIRTERILSLKEQIKELENNKKYRKETVEKGALVEIKEGGHIFFFLIVGKEGLHINKDFFAISTSAPRAQILLEKKPGDTYVFEGIVGKILTIE